MEQLKEKARELSKNFLESEKEYRLGFIEAEQSNPKTKTLGETFVRDTKAGIRMILSVDRDLVALFETALFSEKFDWLYADMIGALKNGGRIFISGCGSSGRLAMRLETSFREAINEIAKERPEARAYKDAVREIMTGGDYAIIRAVESFEDYTELGCAQAKDEGVKEGDVLIGVTATGETTSILGTAKQALADGAKVWMVICSDPQSIIGKLKRVDDVFTHPMTESLYMKCGGMAVTGSTRMQSSSIEQAVIGAALEMALGELFFAQAPTDDTKRRFVDGFSACMDLLESDESVEVMAEETDAETELYENGGHVTYFSDEYLLDILADTTERSPTFTTPPFRPQKNKNETLSWAFVKNPRLGTKEAWDACFLRTPRCIDKTPDDYKAIGIKDEDIRRIPNISLDALYAFEIGCEPDPEREGENTLASWVSFGDEIPESFERQAEKYEKKSIWTIGSEGCFTHTTRMKLFEHLGMKMMLNAVSTGTMAKMGRVRGNYMVHLNISNKKLVDRATRIIADLCAVDYDTANYELFYSKLLLEAKGIQRSTTIETIDRLGQK
ncbi:MAG: hypothetical protein IKB87_00565 [Clostridia bacterium]|nr:hypothetical protein [Clostridia bacterium]